MVGVEKVYFGDTWRKLGVRCKEHMYANRDSTKVSNVYSHGIEQHGEVKIENWQVEVMARKKSEFARRFAESAEIASNVYSFNKSTGIQIL